MPHASGSTHFRAQQSRATDQKIMEFVRSRSIPALDQIPTANDIADALHMERTSVNRKLTRLEREGRLVRLIMRDGRSAPYCKWVEKDTFLANTGVNK